jgi:nucleoside-triphosphatase
MMLAKQNLLITGLPGCGKTTLIKRVAGELKRFHPVGFYTEEIREGGVRRGFELASLDGRKGILSHIGIESRFKIGRYRVDISGFESFLDSIHFLDPANHLIIIDEIGKMEGLADKFKRLLDEILNSDKPLIATIAQKGGGTIAEIRRRSDVRILEITRHNRDSLLPEILALVLA